MPVRKFSFLLFVFSILAGFIGAVIGEWLLMSYYGVWPNILLIGAYMGQLALACGLFCLLAEILSPVVNGRSWRLQYSGQSWKMLVPATLVMLFTAGVIFQFFYSLNFANIKPPDDIVLALDISDSMNETDPGKSSLKAAENLLSTMEPAHRAAIISFNGEASVTKPMFEISNQQERADAIKQINGLEYTGKTDIGHALETAMAVIDSNRSAGRKPMVILFSDGYSELDLKAAAKPYQAQNIVINTVGMSKIDRDGAQLLKQIAAGTGGSFHDVKKAAELTKVFEKIYLENQDRLLVTERYGAFQVSTYLSVLRIVLMLLIGGLFGLSLGIIFDNRYLAKSYVAAGLIAGLLAGLVLELGLQDGILSSFANRMTACILLTAATGLGTVLIPIREKYAGGAPKHGHGADLSIRGSSANRSYRNKGF